MRDIGISIVTYSPNLAELSATLSSLRNAAQIAIEAGRISSVQLYLIDNGPGDQWTERLEALCRAQWSEAGCSKWEVLCPGQNLGFGLAHNLAIDRSSGEYHLVLNPDVTLANDALLNAVDYMDKHPEVGCLSPYAEGKARKREYLCKQPPSVLVLILRGFAPAFLRKLFDKKLAAYEMRGVTENDVVQSVPIASGCFMFFRTNTLKTVGGFSPKYFLYFEDFDLSLRVSKTSAISYVPMVKVVHTGGYASKKGLTHIRMFASSGRTFFGEHGWRWI